MTNSIASCFAIVLSCILAAGAVQADSRKLPHGEHLIDTPAIGDGLCVHNLFQSNMVIQRDKPITVRGWAAPGERVTVSLSDQKQTTTAGADRRWAVTLPAMPANPAGQDMKIRGKARSLTFNNILLGDVWVVGGQSNMQHPLSRVENGGMEIVSAHFPKIRILTVPALIDNKTKQAFPRIHRFEGSRHEREGDWDVCSPKTISEFTAIGYIFARRIHMASQVPIGVIDVSRWGTTVEAWTPLPVLKRMGTDSVRALLADWDKKSAQWDPQKDLQGRIKSYHGRVESLKKQGKAVPASWQVPTDLRPGPEMNQNYPGNCYASMLNPIAGFAVKGAIFHQGFNNSRADADTFYYQVFPKMIEAWRTAFNNPKMPFGIISLCTDGPPQSLDNYVECMMNSGIYVREAQYKTFLDFYKAGDKNIGFASSFDLRRAWYHPQLKIPAGERIARWALATQYGFDRNVSWKPPMITEMKTGDGKIILHMDSEVGSVDAGPIAGFAIAGTDKQFQPANAQVLVTGKDSRNRPQYNRRVLILSSPHVPEPIHFRYAWGRNPMANLRPSSTAQKDIPFATQRSDDWKSMENKGASRSSRENHGKAAQLIDLGRRLKDAQTFIDEHQKDYDKAIKTAQ